MNYIELFETITVDRINEWIADHYQEDLFIEFKQVSRPDLSDKEDKRNFAKALSGFANSAGGIVVWGVDARPNKQTAVDAAQAAAPIDRLSLFQNRLAEFTGSFVSPIIDGVRHRILPYNGDSGFAVTLVPVSDAGPHMAMGGEGRYYKRSGSSFYQMEHFDLEDMFGRRRKPLLQLEYRIETAGSSGSGGITTHNGKLILSMKNTGRGTARSPYAAFNVMPPYTKSRSGVSGQGDEGLAPIPHLGQPSLHRFGAAPVVVIHPHTAIDITAVDLPVSTDHKQRIHSPKSLYIAVAYASDDVPLAKGIIELTPDQIIAGVLNVDKVKGIARPEVHDLTD